MTTRQRPDPPTDPVGDALAGGFGAVVSHLGSPVGSLVGPLLKMASDYAYRRDYEILADPHASAAQKRSAGARIRRSLDTKRGSKSRPI